MHTHLRTEAGLGRGGGDLGALDVGQVHVGGQEVPVRRPRHPLLDLALRRVKDGLIRAGLIGNLVSYHFSRLLSDRDNFATKKFLIYHFDNLVNLLVLVGG